MTSMSSRTVMVCLPPESTCDWFTTSEVVEHHLHTVGTPTPLFPVRHRSLVGLINRWRDCHLVDPRRRFGAVTHAAGGRLDRLDLTKAISRTCVEATARWLTWRGYVASSTPVAKPWTEFLAQHDANPDKVSLDEARRRFEAQPRVLAMLAMSHHPVVRFMFDPHELDAFQAGEATYVATRWRRMVTGDVLITAEGTLMRPKGPSLADRLRFQQHAAAYVHQLRPRHHLVALAID